MHKCFLLASALVNLNCVPGFPLDGGDSAETSVSYFPALSVHNLDACCVYVCLCACVCQKRQLPKATSSADVLMC